MSKQSFKKVEPASDIQWINPKEDLAVGDQIEGVYVEPIETSGKFGKKTKYKILTTDRALLGIGGGNLGSLMANVEPGSYLLLTFVEIEHKEWTDSAGEPQEADVAVWEMQQAEEPFVAEVQELIDASAAYKFKPRAAQADAAASTGGRRF